MNKKPLRIITVLVTYKLGDRNLSRIADIDPSIKITDVSDLLANETKGDRKSESHLNTLLARAEVLFAMGLPRELIRRAPKLKWIQLMSAGVNRQLTPEITRSRVTLTNASGMHAAIIAEHIMMQMLMVVKKAPQFFLNQMEKKWQRLNVDQLTGSTIGIIGLGSIGRETARLAKAFGMKVIATRRSAKSGQRARYVDEMVTISRLQRLLHNSDFVAICAPLTKETTGLIGEKELKTMKPTAYLINIARGKIVDEGALIRAIQQKWIAGAMLDTFPTEPLPTESPLWEFPPVIVTPHIAGQSAKYVDKATEIFIDNLRRYIEGKRLHNLVNKKMGY